MQTAAAGFTYLLVLPERERQALFLAKEAMTKEKFRTQGLLDEQNNIVVSQLTDDQKARLGITGNENISYDNFIEREGSQDVVNQIFLKKLGVLDADNNILVARLSEEQKTQLGITGTENISYDNFMQKQGANKILNEIVYTQAVVQFEGLLATQYKVAYVVAQRQARALAEQKAEGETFKTDREKEEFIAEYVKKETPRLFSINMQKINDALVNLYSSEGQAFVENNIDQNDHIQGKTRTQLKEYFTKDMSLAGWWANLNKTHDQIKQDMDKIFLEIFDGQTSSEILTGSENNENLDNRAIKYAQNLRLESQKVFETFAEILMTPLIKASHNYITLNGATDFLMGKKSLVSSDNPNVDVTKLSGVEQWSLALFNLGHVADQINNLSGWTYERVAQLKKQNAELEKEMRADNAESDKPIPEDLLNAEIAKQKVLMLYKIMEPSIMIQHALIDLANSSLGSTLQNVQTNPFMGTLDYTIYGMSRLTNKLGHALGAEDDIGTEAIQNTWQILFGQDSKYFMYKKNSKLGKNNVFMISEFFNTKLNRTPGQNNGGDAATQWVGQTADLGNLSLMNEQQVIKYSKDNVISRSAIFNRISSIEQTIKANEERIAEIGTATTPEQQREKEALSRNNKILQTENATLRSHLENNIFVSADQVISLRNNNYRIENIDKDLLKQDISAEQRTALIQEKEGLLAANRNIYKDALGLSHPTLLSLTENELEINSINDQLANNTLSAEERSDFEQKKNNLIGENNLFLKSLDAHINLLALKPSEGNETIDISSMSQYTKNLNGFSLRSIMLQNANGHNILLGKKIPKKEDIQKIIINGETEWTLKDGLNPDDFLSPNDVFIFSDDRTEIVGTRINGATQLVLGGLNAQELQNQSETLNVNINIGQYELSGGNVVNLSFSRQAGQSTRLAGQDVSFSDAWLTTRQDWNFATPSLITTTVLGGTNEGNQYRAFIRSLGPKGELDSMSWSVDSIIYLNGKSRVEGKPDYAFLKGSIVANRDVTQSVNALDSYFYAKGDIVGLISDSNSSDRKTKTQAVAEFATLKAQVEASGSQEDKAIIALAEDIIEKNGREIESRFDENGKRIITSEMQELSDLYRQLDEKLDLRFTQVVDVAIENPATAYQAQSLWNLSNVLNNSGILNRYVLTVQKTEKDETFLSMNKDESKNITYDIATLRTDPTTGKIVHHIASQNYEEKVTNPTSIIDGENIVNPDLADKTMLTLRQTIATNVDVSNLQKDNNGNYILLDGKTSSQFIRVGGNLVYAGHGRLGQVQGTEVAYENYPVTQDQNGNRFVETYRYNPITKEFVPLYSEGSPEQQAGGGADKVLFVVGEGQTPAQALAAYLKTDVANIGAPVVEDGTYFVKNSSAEGQGATEKRYIYQTVDSVEKIFEFKNGSFQEVVDPATKENIIAGKKTPGMLWISDPSFIAANNLVVNSENVQHSKMYITRDPENDNIISNAAIKGYIIPETQGASRWETRTRDVPTPRQVEVPTQRREVVSFNIGFTDNNSRYETNKAKLTLSLEQQNAVAGYIDQLGPIFAQEMDMSQYEVFQIVAEGGADYRPTQRKGGNKKLSEDRAQALVDVIAEGIEKKYGAAA
ncbi:MAG TPA: hypothetical protein PKH98_00580, partial [Candidatus Omnitrophota bacterium]|nr:hypothetical protein [Candidatus Omnitrophota bacterium]